MKKIIGLVCMISFLAWQLPEGNGYWENKVAPSLLSQLEAGETVDFLVVLTAQADVSASKNIRGKEAKGEFVYKQLKALATTSQQGIWQLLQNNHVEFKSFFVINAVYTKGDINLARQLALLPEVKELQANLAVPLEAPFEDRTANANRNVIEWGIEMIQADKVWNLGYTGQNVIVAGADTGVEWEHPAISQKYKGWSTEGLDHNYNWHDAIHAISPLHNDSIIDPSNNPCGLNTTAPCDDHNHGTHTVGTMTGEDGENQIGVAPGARWIACRNMERGWGSPASYIECFEWFIAPTDMLGENPDPAKAPHVINNSWGCPPIEGCNSSNWSGIDIVIQNVRAAGIVPVVSAGNSGSSCGSISNPAAMFESSFTIGASRSNDTLANFSSRGTVTIDSSGRMKPNVVAPGAGVRSCTRDSSYATWSGTSMAGPHVAGVVALMISANPDLAGEVDVIEDILEATAIPKFTADTCGGVLGTALPNPFYGFGRIDALAAVEEALLFTPVSDTPIGTNDIFTVYPNPFKQNLTLKATNIPEKVAIHLFNANGQVVYSETFTKGMAVDEKIDVGHLPDGVYFYQFIGKSVLQTGKVVKFGE